MQAKNSREEKNFGHWEGASGASGGLKRAAKKWLPVFRKKRAKSKTQEHSAI
jgi:hypothetical protein